jgi:glutathione peroxidase
MKKMSFILVCSVLLKLGNPYGFSLYTAEGKLIKLSQFSGKKILIVNTASDSKYSRQYDSLEMLAKQYLNNLVILAVPSNSFNNEPESNADISSKLHASSLHFIVCSKSNVAGSSQDSLFQWLSRKDLNGMADCSIGADFQKFLIDEQGQLIGIFAPSVSPLSKEMREAIQNTN